MISELTNIIVLISISGVWDFDGKPVKEGVESERSLNAFALIIPPSGEEFLILQGFLRGKARFYFSSNSTSKENGPILNTVIGERGDDSGPFVA
ncbi:hypothetical protein TNIN_366741 [Trichonephila inaurata madagascariensis]|uniref:Uncharacterized protein n=1 Tax=Trichonephila inaurata madagascariensis TaxID=2747483 RepID=A0A8X6J615_9ARAC|nr:hypothetical protein TNIN_366741 [Trichonephila inaurata madagascariensis]